jgi:hypothetical protein
MGVEWSAWSRNVGDGRVSAQRDTRYRFHEATGTEGKRKKVLRSAAAEAHFIRETCEWATLRRRTDNAKSIGRDLDASDES